MLKKKTTKNQWRNGLWEKQAKSYLLYGLKKRFFLKKGTSADKKLK